MTFDKQTAKKLISETRHISVWPTAAETKLANLLEAAIGHIEMLEVQAAVWESERGEKR